MKKRIYQPLAILLTILMLIQVLPMSVIASEVQNAAVSGEARVDAAQVSPTLGISSESSDEPEQKQDATILYEETEKREEYVKHFRMSDGSVQAASYQTPVHYWEDGAWKDIDLTVDDASPQELEYGKNGFESRFSKKSNGKKLVTVTKEGYTLSWGLLDAKKVDAEYQSSALSEKTADPSALKNLTGSVTYANVLENVDVEYRISGEGIKENIILKNENAPQEVSFHYETKHLSWRVTQEGDLALFDPQDANETVFLVEKPFLYDSARVYCDRVEMRVEEVGNGKFTLTLIPDEAWLSSDDRVWPVVIDPAILSSQKAADIWDIDMQSNQTGAHSYVAPDLLVGCGYSSVVCRSLIRFPTLPDIGKSDVVKAVMRIVPYPGPCWSSAPAREPRPAGPIQVNAHPMTALWPETGVTWGAWAHRFDPVVEDYFLYDNTAEYFTLDLTQVVSGWYLDPSQNFGIMLKAADETANGKLMQFASSDWGQDGTSSEVIRPMFSVYYRSKVGLEDYWSYTTQSSVDGTGYINNFNGNLTWVLPDATYNSGLNGFTVSHVYNTANATKPGAYGLGWNINLHERIGGASDFGVTDATHYLIDGDGTRHFFVLRDGKYVDEDGLGYEYVYTGDSPYPHYLINKEKTVFYYDASCNLRRITDANGNSIDINYEALSTGWGISSVTASTGGSIQFAYNSSGLLSSVTDSAGRTTSYTYAGQLLASVTKPDGGEITLGYEATANLDWLRFPDHSAYRYTFDSRGRVATVFQIGSSQVNIRRTHSFAYEYCQTAVTEGDYTLTYQFDTLGRPTCIYDNRDQSYTQSYTRTSLDSDKIFANNKVTLTASSVQYVNNLLNNSTFATGFEGWSVAGQTSVVTDQKYLSSHSVKIVGASEGIHVIQQTPRYESGGTYTYSGYLKWENVSSTQNGGVGLEIVTSLNGGTNWYLTDFLTGSSDPTVENGFVRFEKTITLSPGETIQRVTAGIYHAAGTVWINGIQFEEGECANHVNLLSNTSFEADLPGTGTPSYFQNNAPYGAVAGEEAKFGAQSYRITGVSSLNQYICRMTGLSGKAGDVYTFGAWTKADSLPSHETDGSTSFKMVMQVVPADGSPSQWADINFNEKVSSWQFGSQTVVIEKDYSDIYVFLCYYKNANTAYFDAPFLYRDTAQSYRYDTNGNVISTTNYASQENAYSYQNNDLSKLTSPDGSGFEYYYDAKGNLLSSHSAEGLVNQFTYDEKGNPIASETFANGSSAAIQSGKTYYIQMKSTGEYLSVQGTNVVEIPFTGGAEQKWKFVASPKGGYTISPENAPTMVLEVEGISDAEDANVQICPQNGGDNQRFFVKPQNNYTYQLVPAHSANGKVVTLNRPRTPDNITILTPQGEMNPDQCWIIKETEAATTLEEGLYHIRARHSGAYLEVPGCSSAVGTALQQHQYNDSKSQIFYIKSDGDGAYLISPVYALDQYIQYSVTRDADYLELVELGDGTVGIEDPFCFQYDSTTGDWAIFCKYYPKFYFYINPANTANGAGVVVRHSNSGPHQRFILEKVSPRMTSSMTYQDNGNFPESVTDSRGNTTHYEYDFTKGTLTSTTDPKGNITGYSYNAQNDLLMSVSQGSSAVNYTYQNGSHLQRISSPSGTQYNFVYDEYYQNTQIRVGTQPLSTNEYDEEGKITKTTYGNGEYLEFVYDDLDRVVEKKYNGTTKVTYHYDKVGKIYKSQDLFENTTTRYRYDLSGRILEAKRSDGKILRYTYDGLNRVSSITTTQNGTTTSTEYLYGNTANGQKAGLVYGVKENGTQTLSYTYDELVRLNTRTLNAAGGFTTEYGYLEGASVTDTTALVKTVKNGNDVLSYTYDELGNITSVKKNGTLVESYTYDSQNQLASVTRGTDVWTYTYDNGGNILSVKKNGMVEKSYTYGNANWNDLLTAFQGQSITYDAIGNPLQYRDGFAFTWENGRRLATVNKTGLSATYSYNADGLRTSKTVNGIATTYHWLEGTLLGQTTGSDTILFFYDENGSAYGFALNGTAYYYIFNLQGDVIGILNSTGAQVVAYDYDAWGNLLSVTGDTTLGTLNPLRYRGYYYDTETGFYYLQSRYYDPITQRFINADGYVSTGQGLLGYNMFAYCLNSPVNFADPTGYECVCLRRRVNANRHRCGPISNQTVDLTEKLTDFMEDNADRLKEYKEKNGTLRAYSYFITNVTDGGSLDIKLQEEWKFEDGIEYTFNGKVLRYDDPGNINFGYVGAVLFPKEILCFGAGLNQISKYGFRFGDLTTWYDDPRDNEMIRYGFDLYQSGAKQ